MQRRRSRCLFYLHPLAVPCLDSNRGYIEIMVWGGAAAPHHDFIFPLVRFPD